MFLSAWNWFQMMLSQSGDQSSDLPTLRMLNNKHLAQSALVLELTELRMPFMDLIQLVHTNVSQDSGLVMASLLKAVPCNLLLY
jgi:hypothetical protein